MKRTSRLGGLIACAVLLSGCDIGASANTAADQTGQVPALKSDQKVSIVFESYNYGLAGPWTDTLNERIAAFEKKFPNITVTAQKPQGNSPNPATDAVSSVQKQVVAGTPPDVTQLGFSDLDFTVNQLGAKSLDALFGKPAVQDNFDGGKHPYAKTARTLATWKGTNYGVPFVLSTPVLYYNATLFKQAGLDPNKPPTTWQEAGDAAKAIATTTGKGGIYIDCLSKTAKDWCFQSLVRSNGGAVISDDRTSLTFDKEATVEVTKMAQELVNAGAFPNLSQKQGYEAFAAGEMGMILESSSIQGTFMKGAEGKWDLRSTTMPSFAGKPTIPTNSGASLYIFAKDKAKQAAAWELIKFLTSDESYVKIAQGIGYLPLRPGLVDDPEGLKTWATDNPLLKPNIEQLAMMEPWISMPGNNYLQIRDGMMEAVEQIVFQGADPASTLQKARKQGSALMPK
ncbi:carbohydrate ABC transporter substrate-binding protein (CUT1 family) [Antricoccus suffuscus]|uniref:Carbohydrate ABC transporter substrate-binding protein (CUT1 family) n=1 Tax=Antricoccus suffuscus TaxID=1629062 RepID=A0A2T1A793_9ACTN|nr:ABC transporter substrate-binding protein [Antricoccus suffuscus]PRZ44424.1 carbohydrate ABC transporter substrate-binding protein (CUT1 family) [Antricoccus suffuscus]